MRFGSLAAAAVVLSVPSAALAQATEQDARLETLVQLLDERREALHIPGMAIAVVRDGEVILAEGLGLADLETERPVTPETVFAIGSSTKTFTSALVGIGVDRHKLRWETPVSTYIPWFRLPDADNAQDVNLIDLLSHRTGLTRMSVLWYGGGASIQEMYAAVPSAEYFLPFREAWLYNNVTYAAAGHAAAEVEGLTWEQLLQRDILDPVGMDDTSPEIAHLADNPDAALGYLWDAEKSEYDNLPPRELSKIAPAGAINSNITDMAKWLGVLLNNGALPDGTQLISADALATCWSPHSEMPGGRSYGLGWMIAEFEGTPYYEHGGNIDGFASTLAVMPDEGIGLSVLMNVSASPMQAEVIQHVFNALLSDAETDAEAESGDDLASFTGSYFFEALGGDLVVTLGEDGRLSCDIPGQGTSALNPPDGEGFFSFSVNPAARLRFQPDETGRIVAIEFVQGPAELLLPRRDADGDLITPDVPFDDAHLALLTGGFHHDELGETCTVTLEDGLLAMDVPSQQSYALAWDAESERWRFRDYPGITLEFVHEPGQPATSITFSQSGRTTIMPRVDAPDPSDLPTIADLDALRAAHLGTKELSPTRTMRITGNARLVHQGASGSWVAWADGQHRHAQRTDLSPFAVMRSFQTPEHAVDVSPMAPEPTTDEPGTAAFELAATSHPWLAFAPLAWYAPEARVSGIEAFEDVPDAVVVVSETALGNSMRMYLHPDTGRTLGVRVAVPVPGFGSIPIVTRFEDWRSVAGVSIPHLMVVSNPFTGEMEITCEQVEFDVNVPPEAFQLDPESHDAG